MISFSTLFLILLGSTTLASAQQCQVALGVASSNTVCHSDILDEIKLYSQIVYRDECGVPGTTPPTTGGTRHRLLRANNEEQQRDLQTQQQCDTWQTYCYLGFGQYYCQAYYSCLRRDLGEKEHEDEDSAAVVIPEDDERQLTTGQVDPLNDPYWVACNMNFGQFISNVGDDFLATYATNDIRECWKHMWCRATNTAGGARR